jgi:hypothetical protein
MPGLEHDRHVPAQLCGCHLLCWRACGLLQPDVGCQVSFKLFGLLPGSVGLRGKVLPVAAGQKHGDGVAGEKDTVRVLFEPPVLSLGESIHFRIGGCEEPRVLS